MTEMAQTQQNRRPGGVALRIVACFIACLLSAGAAKAAALNPMLHAKNGTLVDGRGNTVLLRCVNLSPWLVPEGYLVARGSLGALTTSPSQIKQRLEAVVGPREARAFWRRWTDNFVTASDFRHLKEEGFNCVRLPFNSKDIVSSETNGRVALNPEGIAPLDRAVAWGAEYGIYVILDLHDAPGGQNPLPSVSDVPSTDRIPRLWKGRTAAANRQETVALWRALAARYAHARSVGGYDLLNEPALPFGASKYELPRLYGATVAAIRSVDPSHLVILEGNRYAHDFSTLLTPPDRNLMYEFHEYALFNRAWRRPRPYALAPLLRLRTQTRLPIWLGEFGENTLEWQEQVVRLMKSNGIGWAVWPWKRINLKNGHPVIETIQEPTAWKEVSGYLVGDWLARKPSRALMETAMKQMLQAVRTPNCIENRTLETILAGKPGAGSP